jgi:signal transduction histidine kinase
VTSRARASGITPERNQSARPAGSTGLGLDIARGTAVASGGDLLIDRAPGGGARVTMRLGPPATAD